MKQTLLKKAKELGLHLGYNNKLEEFIDFSLKEVKKMCAEMPNPYQNIFEKHAIDEEISEWAKIEGGKYMGYERFMVDIISKLSEVEQ